MSIVQAGDRMHFGGRLALQQRVLTPYRARFFEALAQACESGLHVIAGTPRPAESIATIGELRGATFTTAHNLHFMRGSLYLCYQMGLLKWLEAVDPDALIMEANPRYLSSPAAIHWMKQRQAPVLGWGLGAPARPGVFSRMRNGRRDSFLGSFDVLISYSRRGADEYAALGFPGDRIFVAPNAAVPRPTEPLPTRPASFIGKPCVLFVGRLQARKRVDNLLQACASLPPDLQPRLVIVGDGPERLNLETLARSIYPAAEFPGSKHGPELVPYFRAADLFVLPGTGGLAVQEAMSHGLPVIMGKGDGTNADLVGCANGWQVDEGVPLVGVLAEALSDAGHLRELGAESYRIVAEEVNLERMVAVFVEALNTVMQARKV